MQRRIESFFIPGPAGRLEALLEEPDEMEPVEAVLICHPHPRHGGTMHNKVVFRLARGLRRSGSVVLRFNYRGVGLSEGSYDHGVGETGDARAALALLRERYPRLPIALAGFSFGSRVILRLGCENPEAARLIAAGFPSAYHDVSQFEPCRPRRIFIQSTRDQFGPREELMSWILRLSGAVELHFVKSSDHFFTGGLESFEALVSGLRR